MNLSKLNNSAEIYLMIILRNIKFHDYKSIINFPDVTFTELDKNDCIFLLAVLKLCQNHLQLKEKSKNFLEIKGIPKFTKEKVFEKCSNGEIISVPFAYLKA